MQEYLYSYQSITRFSSKVSDHSWLLRCEPYLDSKQTLIKNDVTVFPDGHESIGKDSWGATIRYGRTALFHDIFGYISTGIVRIGDNIIKDDTPSTIFLMQSELTTASTELLDFTTRKAGCNLDCALFLCQEVHDKMTYSPGCTNTMTKASEAFTLGKGVCQDFAHIFISLCRTYGIPARYICGLVQGEGETHAWVEIWDKGLWVPIDPTAGRLAEDGYIKIAHGRDALDCPVNRGLFKGIASQTTETKVVVERL